jgi:uncharacterized protein (TIGR02246 family)
MSSNHHGRDPSIANGAMPPPDQAERAVQAVFDATSNAWADGDANAFVARYAEDATVILPGILLQGKTAVRTGMENAFAGPLKDTRRIHAFVSVRLLSSDAAIVVTRSATTFPGEPEPSAERWEIATWVLTRFNGQWRIEAYHSCPAR